MAFKPDITLAAIRSLTGGSGGTRGKNCTIRSITETADPETGRTGHIVTFAWSTDDGDARTSTMTVWDGENGENGESPTVGISNIAGGHRITFTDVDGDRPVDVMDGQSVTITIETIDGGNVVTFESASGTQSITIMNGTDGADGTSFVVNGQYATEAELRAAHPVGSKGDAYNVGTASNSTIFLWDIDVEDWTDIGSIKGEKGDDGFTPTVTVERTATNDGVIIKAINRTGEQSATVNDGTPGAAGADGVAGATFTPMVSDDGVLSWTNDGGKANPSPVNIQGPKGENGAAGADGAAGATFTPAVNDDGVLSWTNDGGKTNPDPVNIKGPKGDKGDPGDSSEAGTIEDVTAIINGTWEDN